MVSKRGRWWMAAAGAAMALAVCSGVAQAAKPTETKCIVLGKGPDGEIKKALDDVHVLDVTRTSPAFSVNLPPGFSGGSLECGRSDIVPDENDWKVLEAGYPLTIVVFEGDKARLLVLESVDGRLRVRMIEGTLTEAEAQRAQARLNQLQTAMQDAFMARKSQQNAQ